MAGTDHDRKYAQPSTRDIARAKASSSGLIVMVERGPQKELCTWAITIVRHATLGCRDSRSRNVTSARPKRECYKRQSEYRDMLLRQGLMVGERLMLHACTAHVRLRQMRACPRSGRDPGMAVSNADVLLRCSSGTVPTTYRIRRSHYPSQRNAMNMK